MESVVENEVESCMESGVESVKSGVEIVVENGVNLFRMWCENGF